MIAKIGINNNLYSTLAYNFEKIKQGEAHVLSTQFLSGDLKEGMSFNDCYNDFNSLLPKDTRCKSPILHVSLNPHPDDKLSDDKLKAIGEEYMRELGYGDQPFVIFKHEDIEREHIHIVSLRVDENGKKIDDSFEHKRSKAITDLLEIKYKLNKKTYWEERKPEQVSKADFEVGNTKKQIANVVKPLMKSYNFQSFGEWNALLSLYNVVAEKVEGENDGNLYSGLLYSVTDDNGEKQSIPVKASRFGKEVGVQALTTKYTNSKDYLKEHFRDKDRVKSIVTGIMQFSPSRDDLITRLKYENIDVVFRENDKGRIYGITFIDHHKKTVLNGSRLGKKFSANIFNNYFNGEGDNPFLSEKFAKGTFNKQEYQKAEDEGKGLLDTIISEEIDLSDIQVHGIDQKELAFIRKMRRLHGGKKIKRRR